MGSFTLAPGARAVRLLSCLWPTGRWQRCRKPLGFRAMLWGRAPGRGTGSPQGRRVPSPQRLARHFRKDLGKISPLCPPAPGEGEKTNHCGLPAARRDKNPAGAVPHAFSAGAAQTATKAAPALTPPPGPHPATRRSYLTSGLSGSASFVSAHGPGGAGNDGRARGLAARVADEGESRSGVGQAT